MSFLWLCWFLYDWDIGEDTDDSGDVLLVWGLCRYWKTQQCTQDCVLWDLGNIHTGEDGMNDETDVSISLSKVGSYLEGN